MNLELFPESQTLLVPSTPVERFDNEIEQVSGDMIATMFANDGVGLSAPQVGINKRFFVMKADPYGLPYHAGLFFINPVIVQHSLKKIVWDEGCLSLPGIYGAVERSASVTVKYRSIKGGRFEQHFSGMEARIIQHECDHLDGILFPQRIHKTKTGQWLELKPYSRTELSRLDFINESRKGKTKNRQELGLHQSK